MKVKKNLYKNITKEIINLYSDNSNKVKEKVEYFIKKAKKINTTDQILSYPFRSGTLILPIGCLGGMAYKIWREERPRFVNRFAFDNRFEHKIKSGDKISDLLIGAYDNIGKMKALNEPVEKLIKEIIFLISVFSPFITDFEINELAESYAQDE